MRIEWIEVENFKGFEKQRFEFDEHFTLIVGENGSGKTSAVEAIRLVLSGWVNAAKNKPTAIPASVIRQLGRAAGGAFLIEPQLPLRISGSVWHCVDSLRFEVLADTTDQDELYQGPGDLFRRAFKGPASSVLNTCEAGARPAPLVAYFPAARLFGRGEGPDYNRLLGGKPTRLDGYEDWDQPSDAVTRFEEWLGRWQMIGEEDQLEPGVLRATREAIVGAMPGIAGLRFSPKRGGVVVESSHGELCEIGNLSDGQRCTLSMIADIARRAALLNPHLDNPAKSTTGVVVIDEIDLHLHPRWQRRIMEDLRRVFPKIQFIATTHSPIIISAAKDAKIIRLDADGSREIPQGYGMDVNWVVDVVQGAESQATEVVQLISKIEDLIEDARMEEARHLIPELEKLQKGPSPDSVRLDAEIDNLIALANAED